METIKKEATLLKQRLEQLKNEQCLIENQLSQLGKQIEPKAQYGNIKALETAEGVRLAVYLLNGHEKKEHMDIFGYISGDWKDSRGSVAYFRNEYGVLNHTGGGWLLLRDGIPCSDDEWENIKQGIIPDKFRSQNL